MKCIRKIIISSPVNVENEISRINKILDSEIWAFHLRKPGLDINSYRNFIEQIDTDNYKNIIISDFPELVFEYNLKGFHISGRNFEYYSDKYIQQLINNNYIINTSSHSFEELESIPEWCNQTYFGPVFSSISKQGYLPKYTLSEIENFIKNTARKTKIIALGGMSEHNAKQVINAGFDGYALLGSVWC